MTDLSGLGLEDSTLDIVSNDGLASKSAAMTLGPERRVGPTHGDFQALVANIRDARLLDRRSGYYTLKVLLTIGAFAGGWATFFNVGNSWLTTCVAVFLGVMFTQLAFIAHDAGHQQVFRSREGNRLLGLAVGDALIGLSFGWWVGKHNAHHANPNQLNKDPDVSNGGVFTTDGVDEVPHGLGRALTRWQAALFFPLMLLRSPGLHVSGTVWLFQKRDRSAAVEGALIAVHTAVYLTAVLWVLAPTKAVVFILVQQGVFSIYLGCSFAPNHKGMLILDADAKMPFVQKQVLTARNVAGGRFLNFVLGGLNCQIEHHLFPTMPRPNLARARRLVRAFCLETGLGYCEDSLVGSYRQTIRFLAASGATGSGGVELQAAAARL